MKLQTLLFAFVMLLCLSVQAQDKTETLTNKQVIDLVKAGLPEDIILSKISQTNGKFDLSTNGLIALKTAKVPSAVIQAMLDKGQGTVTTAKPVAAPVNAPSIATKPAKNTDAVQIEALNNVFLLEDGKALPLERAQANQKTKTKAFGYGGASVVMEITGEASNVKLTADKAQFVIKTGGATPPDIMLYKLTIAKKNRSATILTATMMGTKDVKGIINLTVSNLQEGVFKLVPSQTLETGEYFFMNRSTGNNGITAEVYAFSIQ